jgi:hypothetical protein
VASTTVRIKGKADILLKRRLNQLAKKDIKKISRASVSKAMTPMMQAVRKNAPKQEQKTTGRKQRKELKEAKGRAKSMGTWAAGNLSDAIGFGALKKSIGKKVKSFKNNVGSWVGPRTKYEVPGGTGKTGKKRPAWYAHLVEGWRTKAKPHRIATPWPDGRRKSVKHPGIKNITPFIQHSAETTKAKTAKVLRTELRQRITKAAKVRS